jgi:hypothetical protein
MPAKNQFYLSHADLARLRRISHRLEDLNLQVSLLLRRLPTLRIRKQCVNAAESLRTLALQHTSLRARRHEMLLSAIEPDFSLFVLHFGQLCDNCRALPPIQHEPKDYEVLGSQEVFSETERELDALLDLADLAAEVTRSRSSRDEVTKTILIRAISLTQKALLRQKRDLRLWKENPEPEFKVVDCFDECGRCKKPMPWQWEHENPERAPALRCGDKENRK